MSSLGFFAIMVFAVIITAIYLANRKGSQDTVQATLVLAVTGLSIFGIYLVLLAPSSEFTSGLAMLVAVNIFWTLGRSREEHDIENVIWLFIVSIIVLAIRCLSL